MSPAAGSRQLVKSNLSALIVAVTASLVDGFGQQLEKQHGTTKSDADGAYPTSLVGQELHLPWCILRPVLLREETGLVSYLSPTCREPGERVVKVIRGVQGQSVFLEDEKFTDRLGGRNG